MSILHKIKISLDKELPFVAYKKPNDKILSAFFQHDATVHVTSTYDEKGFVFAPFDDKKEAIFIPNHKATFISEDLKFEAIKLNSVLTSDESSKKYHLDIVEKGIKTIKEGEFKKVVLSRKESILKEDVDVITIFHRLLNTYDNAFVYIWFHPKVGLWLGATPETLIKINDNLFETMSLAGTQVYQKDKEVFWKSKEIDEQQLVTDYVLQKLKSICKSVKSSEVNTIKAGNLLHLKTTIKGELCNSASEIIHMLHPTPAVCGFPKDKSKEFILKTEGYDRKFYTGFLGELNMPNSELFVNLRCMEVEEKQVNIYVGGGITKDSNPENEWNETLAKSKTMKIIL